MPSRRSPGWPTKSRRSRRSDPRPGAAVRSRHAASSRRNWSPRRSPRCMPEEAVITDEAVTFGRGFFPFTYAAPPHDWLNSTGGAIGCGPPLATGAAVGAPGRRVIALQADGSAMYTLQALWTQARERLDVTTVLLSNRKYQILLGELANVGANPGRTALDMLDLGNPDLDWTRLARGMGVEAARAETCERFARPVRPGQRAEGTLPDRTVDLNGVRRPEPTGVAGAGAIQPPRVAAPRSESHRRAADPAAFRRVAGLHQRRSRGPHADCPGMAHRQPAPSRRERYRPCARASRPPSAGQSAGVRRSMIRREMLGRRSVSAASFRQAFQADPVHFDIWSPGASRCRP